MFAMMILIAIAILFTFAAWSILYFYLLRRFPNYREEFASRLISTTHAVIICRLLELLQIIGPWPMGAIGEPNTVAQNCICAVSTGYFIFDFVLNIYKGKEDPVMFSHHLVSITTLVGCVISGYSGAEIGLTLWGSELSNPFWQLRWFLREFKMYESPVATINDVIFMFVFLFARLVMGPRLLYAVLTSRKSTLFMKCGGTLFQVISVVWACQILAFARRRFVLKSKGKDLKAKSS